MRELPDDLRGEDWLFAILLSVLAEACSTTVEDELKSWERAAYAHAMKELDQAGFVEIQSRAGNQIVAKITPRGKSFLNRLSDEVGSLA